MKVVEIRKKATAIGVNSGKMNKKYLIRAIQKKEGNSECFDTAMPQCPEMECCWRSDCMTD